MEKYGRFVFFDKSSGKVLLITVERFGGIPLSANDIISNDETLSNIDVNSYDYIQLDYGQFSQDFIESNGYRVNPKTKELEFSYPDPNQPEQPPVYQKPLSEQIDELKSRQESTEEAISFLLGL